MPLDEKLLAAYRTAAYVVCATPETVLRVGEASTELDALLEAEGAAGAVFITAANPGSVAHTSRQNLMATAALVESQNALGFACYQGEGRDPTGSWPAEPSVLVVGISRVEAEALGRAFGQNAIVWFDKGGVGELVVLV